MNTPPALSIAFSPCPNDTFIFNALINQMITPRGFSLSEVFYEDVETLNRWAMSGKMAITKLSFHALGHCLDTYELLQAGSALGRGCGPLLVCRDREKFSALKNPRIAIPGQYTTASLLLKMCFPEYRNTSELRFDHILAAVAEGRVDAGVIIHESRFTYEAHGLQCFNDLGAWWEESTGHPIPLGCIAARKDLGSERIAQIDSAVYDSLSWARQHPSLGCEYIKEHAQEIDDEVIASHIELYVNDFTLGLGSEGLAAVREFLDRGNACGAFSGTSACI